MTTTRRDAERAKRQTASAAGVPGDGATGRGSGPLRRAVVRAVLVAASAAGLGFAAGSWAADTGGEATTNEHPSCMEGDRQGGGTGAVELPPGHPPLGCALPPGHPPIDDAGDLPPGHPPIDTLRDLPPGHPPIGALRGLPPGHPPVRAVPRLPAGHPPLDAMPAPTLLAPQGGSVII